MIDQVKSLKKRTSSAFLSQKKKRDAIQPQRPIDSSSRKRDDSCQYGWLFVWWKTKEPTQRSKNHPKRTWIKMTDNDRIHQLTHTTVTGKNKMKKSKKFASLALGLVSLLLSSSHTTALVQLCNNGHGGYRNKCSLPTRCFPLSSPTPYVINYPINTLKQSTVRTKIVCSEPTSHSWTGDPGTSSFRLSESKYLFDDTAY